MHIVTFLHGKKIVLCNLMSSFRVQNGIIAMINHKTREINDMTLKIIWPSG